MNQHAKAKFLDFHRMLLADKVRTESYRRAIFKTVKRGDVVLDLGTGTGILAHFACQAGAKRVYAIDTEKEAIEIAKHIAVQNGLQSRIVFINDHSYLVNLPERVDVIATETTSNFGLEEGVLGFILDARKRFLKKGGLIIPQSIKLWIVPVELPQVYRKVNFWSRDLFGIDFSRLDHLAMNRYYQTSLKVKSFISRPACLGEIKLSRVEAPLFSGNAFFVTKRPGTLHGVGGWFSSELSSGIFLSNQPPNQAEAWTNVFFPSIRPFRLEKGEHLKVKIISYNGVSWNWRIKQNGATCEDSDFQGSPLSKEELLKNSPRYMPRLSHKGRVELFLMGMIRRRKTIQQMEKGIRSRYPNLFHDQRATSAFVQEVVSRCGQ